MIADRQVDRAAGHGDVGERHAAEAGRVAVVARGVVPTLDANAQAGRRARAAVGHGEVLERDRRIDAVLEVHVDAGRAGRAGAAVGHLDAVEGRMVERLEVQALVQVVVEGRAGHHDVGEPTGVVGDGIGRVGFQAILVVVEMPVRDGHVAGRAGGGLPQADDVADGVHVGDVQAGDDRRVMDFDAVLHAGDVEVVEGGRIHGGIELDAVGRGGAGDPHVFQGDVVGGDGEHGAGSGVDDGAVGSRAGAHDRERLVDIHVFAVGPRRDIDRMAGLGAVHGRLDRQELPAFIVGDWGEAHAAVRNESRRGRRIIVPARQPRGEISCARPGDRIALGPRVRGVARRGWAVNAIPPIGDRVRDHRRIVFQTNSVAIDRIRANRDRAARIRRRIIAVRAAAGRTGQEDAAAAVAFDQVVVNARAGDVAKQVDSVGPVLQRVVADLGGAGVEADAGRGRARHSVSGDRGRAGIDAGVRVNPVIAPADRVAGHRRGGQGLEQEHSRTFRQWRVAVAANGVAADRAARAVKFDAVLGDQGGRAGPGYGVVLDIHGEVVAHQSHAVFLVIEDVVVGNGQQRARTTGDGVGIDSEALLIAVERVIANVLDGQPVHGAAGVEVGQADKAVVAAAQAGAVDGQIGNVAAIDVLEEHDGFVDVRGCEADGEAKRRLNDRACPGADDAQVFAVDHDLPDVRARLKVDRVAGRGRVHTALNARTARAIRHGEAVRRDVNVHVRRIDVHQSVTGHVDGVDDLVGESVLAGEIGRGRGGRVPAVGVGRRVDRGRRGVIDVKRIRGSKDVAAEIGGGNGTGVSRPTVVLQLEAGAAVRDRVAADRKRTVRRIAQVPEQTDAVVRRPVDNVATDSGSDRVVEVHPPAGIAEVVVLDRNVRKRHRPTVGNADAPGILGEARVRKGVALDEHVVDAAIAGRVVVRVNVIPLRRTGVVIVPEQVIHDLRLVGAAGIGQEQAGDVVLNDVVEEVSSGGAGRDINAGPNDVVVRIALDGEALDRRVAGADRQRRGAVGRALDHRFADTSTGPVSAGIGPEQRDGLVDVDGVRIASRLDVDRVAGECRIDAVLNIAAGGSDVDVAGIDAHEADAAAAQESGVERISDLVLDAVQLRQRRRGPGQAVERHGRGVDPLAVQRRVFKIDVVAGLPGEDQVIEAVARDRGQ